jgi:hypothetical protein
MAPKSIKVRLEDETRRVQWQPAMAHIMSGRAMIEALFPTRLAGRTWRLQYDGTGKTKQNIALTRH